VCALHHIIDTAFALGTDAEDALAVAGRCDLSHER